MKKVLLMLVLVLLLNGCSSTEEPRYVNGIEVVNSHTISSILENTRYETEIHTFTSNISGPKILIIGGINGNDIASFNTALKYTKKNNYYQGTVMIIPQAHILATQLEQSYPGRTNNGIFDGVSYSDLNFAFPGTATGTITEKIASEITKVIEDFNPDYIIDLAEDQWSYSSSYQMKGDTIICGNEVSNTFGQQLISKYNSEYKKANEIEFIMGNIINNNFNYYFANTMSDTVVITILTSRELGLNQRISQQTNMIEAIFELAWNY